MTERPCIYTTRDPTPTLGGGGGGGGGEGGGEGARGVSGASSKFSCPVSYEEMDEMSLSRRFDGGRKDGSAVMTGAKTGAGAGTGTG